MGVIIGYNGDIEKDNNTGKYLIKPQGEKAGVFTKINSLQINTNFNANEDSCKLAATRIVIHRNKSYNNVEDMLPLELIFGNGGGERNEVSLIIGIIDDTNPDDNILLGYFSMPRTQIVDVSMDAQNPVQRIILHAYEMNYFNAITNTPLSDNKDVVPLIAEGF